MEELPPTGKTGRHVTEPLIELTALIGSDGLSRFGTSMTVTAVPWFVLVTTGSAAQTGVVVFASGVGVVLALLCGGAVVDRISFRQASVLADLSAGSMVALIPACYLTVGLPFWLLILLVFLGTLFDIPAQVARLSALPDISQKAGIRFERANSLFDGVLTTASLLGPAAAGVFIALIGASNVLWLDAATFWISAVIMRTLVRVPRARVARKTQDRAYLYQIGDAVRFVFREPVLCPLVVILALMNLAIGPLDTVFVPVYVHDVYDSSYVLGLFTSVIAAGGLGGNVIFGWVGHRLSRRFVFGLGFLTIPAVFAVLSLKPFAVISLAALAFAGLGMSLANLLEYTMYFERIPQEMRARGLGITGALNWGTTPIGRLVAGAGIAVFGLAATLTGFALVFSSLPLALLGGVAFRNLNSPAARDAEA